jgi:hypothetical protein
LPVFIPEPAACDVALGIFGIDPDGLAVIGGGESVFLLFLPDVPASDVEPSAPGIGADFVVEILNGLVERDQPFGLDPASRSALFVPEPEPRTVNLIDAVYVNILAHRTGVVIDDGFTDAQNGSGLGDHPLTDPFVAGLGLGRARADRRKPGAQEQPQDGPEPSARPCDFAHRRVLDR